MIKKNRRSKNIYVKHFVLLFTIVVTTYTGSAYWQESTFYASQVYYRYLEFYNSKINTDQKINLKSFGVTIPQQKKVVGIDVSKHQLSIKWDEVAKMRVDSIKIHFAFIKATEGITLKDIYFDKNWKAVADNGIIRGAYHFFKPNRDAKSQAKSFINAVTLSNGDLPPVLDVEQHGKLSAKKLRANLKIWLDIVEKQYGAKPIIYTCSGFYKTYLNSKELKKYKLWIADYKHDVLPLGDSEWHFWQHTNKGSVNGIAGNVDFNVFNGSYEELKNICIAK